jgi:arylsulfatase A-like enzyme
MVTGDLPATTAIDVPPGSSERVSSSIMGIAIALLVVSVPLEMLPSIPAVARYAPLWECVITLGQVGFVLFLLGACIGLGAVCLGGIIGLLLRRDAASSAVRAAHIYTAFLIMFGLFRGLKSWLHEWGQPVTSFATGHSLAWASMTVVGAVVLCAYKGWGARPVVSRGWRWLAGAGMLWLMFSMLSGRSAEPSDHLEESTQLVVLNESSRRPDVVLVTIDTFAASHASFDGYHRNTTPKIDAFARQANVFDRFYANGNFTTAAIQSLIGGVRPWTHRVFWVTDLPTDESAKASILPVFKAAGYRTLAVATNMWASPTRLKAMGYVDELEISNPWSNLCALDPDNIISARLNVHAASIVQASSWYARLRTGFVSNLISSGYCPPSGHFDPDDAFQRALKLLDRKDHGRPFLLWVHLTPPHDPYAPPSPWVGKFDSGKQARTMVDSSPKYHYQPEDQFANQVKRLEGRYDESLLYVDDAVGRFFESLKRRNIYDSSIIAVTADHGESFGHNYGGHGGGELYEDIIRIPFVIKRVDQKQGVRISVPSEQVDLLPTLAELAHLKPLSPIAEGVSLVDAMNGNDRTRGLHPVFSMNFSREMASAPIAGGSVVMIDGPWKLHMQFGKSDPSNPNPRKFRLFDVAVDPGELRDLSAQYPEVAHRMQGLIEAKIAAHRLPRP